MGILMSGTPNCAIRLPSRYSTIECTIDWGWMRMSIRPGGRPNSHVASITSNPLFIRGAESIEIFGPIRPRRSPGGRDGGAEARPPARGGHDYVRLPGTGRLGHPLLPEHHSRPRRETIPPGE